MEIDGQPHVVEILNVLDVTTESFENVREQLTAKVRGYDEELYLDALPVPTTADIMKTASGK